MCCHQPGGVSGMAAGPLLVGGVKTVEKCSNGVGNVLAHAPHIGLAILGAVFFFKAERYIPVRVEVVWALTIIDIFVICWLSPLIAYMFRWLGICSLPITLFYGIVYTLVGHPDNIATAYAPWFLGYSVLVMLYLYFIKPADIK